MSAHMKGWLVSIAAVLLLVCVYGLMKMDAYRSCIQYKNQIQADFTCRSPAWMPTEAS